LSSVERGTHSPGLDFAPVPGMMSEAMSQTSRVGVAHLGVTVSDLDRAIEWYSDVLGMEVLVPPIELSSDDPRIGDQIADVFGGAVRFRQAHMIAAGGVALELFEFSEPETERDPEMPYWRTGVWHICVYGRDIDQIVERVRLHGGVVRSSKIWEVVPGEPYRMCYCEDPFGNVIEVYSHSHEDVFGSRRGY
jgi:catechol 2,3-dioxygenase-like lactoylglutathione lyase family enzyme